MQTIDDMLAARDFAQDPYPAYRRLQTEAPVHWCKPWNAWIVSRFDDIVATLRDHQHFSSTGRQVRLLANLTGDADADAAPIRKHFSTPGLIHADPPDHSRMRSILSRAFSARVIEGLRPRIASIVDELLDEISESGRIDVLADLAYPLPAIVIAELMGAAPEDRDRFRRWSDDIVAFQGTGRARPEMVARSRAGLEDMRGYLADLFARRRIDPGDDLISAMVSAEGDDGRLSTEELYSTCVTFLIAGHETTTSLIVNGMFTLLDHRAQMEEVRESGPDVLQLAVEECLRLESPIQRTFRRVKEPVEFGGHRLAVDDIVIQLLGAANRDPTHFDDPDQFDIYRNPNRHMAFGSGIHFCLGAPLARLEAPIAIRSMLDRLPAIRLAEVPRWEDEKGLFRCLTSLVLEFEPTASDARRPLSQIH